MRNSTLASLILALLLVASECIYAGPSVTDIVNSAIAKKKQDKLTCGRYSMQSTTQQIKYDKDMKPDEITITKKKVITADTKISEGIISIEKSGKPFTPTEVQNKIAELNEEWDEKQKDAEKKSEGSRENFVDPLNLDSLAAYDYALSGEGDSTCQLLGDSNTVVGADARLMQKIHYYIVTAKSKRDDSKYLNATYWIDSANYGILKMTWSPAKLPRFVEMLNFSMVNQPFNSGSTVIYLPNRFELKGRAGFLFFKGRFGVIEESWGYKCDATIPDSAFSKRYYVAGPEK